MDFDLVRDRHFNKWFPPTFKKCVGSVWHNSETHHFVEKDFGRTLWSTYPVACNQCERSCIRSTQNTYAVRAAIEVLILEMERKGMAVDEAGRTQILRVARDFFRAAYENRLREGVYMRDAYTKVINWRHLLDEQGVLLLFSDMKSTPPPREGLVMSMEILSAEATSLQDEISQDTVKLAGYFLEQRWCAHKFWEADGAACRKISRDIGNLRAKYSILPGDPVDHANDDPAWELEEQSGEHWY